MLAIKYVRGTYGISSRAERERLRGWFEGSGVYGVHNKSAPYTCTAAQSYEKETRAQDRHHVRDC